jgi:hypothetical protein
LKNDIKKSAKEQQMSVCRIQAKDLVRTKKHIRKMLQMKTQIQARPPPLTASIHGIPFCVLAFSQQELYSLDLSPCLLPMWEDVVVV